MDWSALTETACVTGVGAENRAIPTRERPPTVVKPPPRSILPSGCTRAALTGAFTFGVNDESTAPLDPMCAA